MFSCSCINSQSNFLSLHLSWTFSVGNGVDSIFFSVFKSFAFNTFFAFQTPVEEHGLFCGSHLFCCLLNAYFTVKVWAKKVGFSTWRYAEQISILFYRVWVEIGGYPGKEENSGWASSKISMFCSYFALAKHSKFGAKQRSPSVVIVPLLWVSSSPFLSVLGIRTAGTREISMKTTLSLHRLPELLGELQNLCPIRQSGEGDFCFRLTGGFIMPEGQYLPWLRLDEYLLLRSVALSADFSRSEDLLFVCRGGCWLILSYQEGLETYLRRSPLLCWWWGVGLSPSTKKSDPSLYKQLRF